MTELPTVRRLVEESTISDAVVRVAIMAVMAGVPGEAFAIARGYALLLLCHKNGVYEG